jgi:hypothetical protein
MRRRPHQHRCDRCNEPQECCGEILQNFDGFPEWICDEYHTSRRQAGIKDFFCEECQRQHDEESEREARENV